MFKIVSKKRWERMLNAESVARKNIEDLFEERKREIKIIEEEVCCEKNKIGVYRTLIKSQNETIAELKKYKGLYLDEVHKRLCLAKMVSELEEGGK